MTGSEKRRRFRQLAKQDRRIRTGRLLAEELEQPFLPFSEFKTRSQPGEPRRAGARQAEVQ